MHRRDLLLIAPALALAAHPTLAQTGAAPTLRLSGEGAEIAITPAGAGRFRVDLRGPDGAERVLARADPQAFARMQGNIVIQDINWLVDADGASGSAAFRGGTLTLTVEGRSGAFRVVGASPNLLDPISLTAMGVGALIAYFLLEAAYRIPRRRLRLIGRRGRLRRGNASAFVELDPWN